LSLIAAPPGGHPRKIRTGRTPGRRTTRPTDAFRQHFLDRCRQQLAELCTLAQDQGRPQVRDRLTALAHTLAGSAGTFGYPDISRHASALETGLRDSADQSVQLDDQAQVFPDRIAGVAAAAEALSRCR
jgi:HPt (histidine-containing phosphotransfer) domain-containing protein